MRLSLPEPPNSDQDKSFADHLNGTRDCTYESKLVLRSTEIHPPSFDLSPSSPTLLGCLILLVVKLFRFDNKLFLNQCLGIIIKYCGV